MDEEPNEGVQGLESSGQEVEGRDNLGVVQSLAEGIDRTANVLDVLTKIDTADLASAAAELDVRAKRMEAEVKRRKARLDEVRKALAERMVNGGISGVRVMTSEGRKLVHLRTVVAPSITAARKGEMVDWLQAHHKELLFVGYNDAEVRGKLATWRKAQEGDFPQELLDAGIIKLYEGQEVGFRKSGK
jgi:hypothetical protein